ncbi:MAG TPA: hypothetical protein VIK64_09640, partial [Anaerolineales bacterium]
MSEKDEKSRPEQHGKHHDEEIEHEAMDHAAHGRDVGHEDPADEKADEMMDHAGHMQNAEHDGKGEHEVHKAHREHAEHNGEHAAHVDHTGHEEMFRRKFWVSLVLSIPVLVFSPTVQGFFGFSLPDFPGSEWITPVFAVIVFFYGGLPFLQMAVPELRNRQPGMMTLISLAISVAFVYSLFATIVPAGETFFWELVTLIDVMLLGHWLEVRSVRQASGALDELAKLMPDTAERIREDGSTETVPVTKLQKDDLVLVRPGSSVPTDGVVEEGESNVNQAMITGESRPVSKKPGDEVIAGTINGDGSLRVRVT